MAWAGAAARAGLGTASPPPDGLERKRKRPLRTLNSLLDRLRALLLAAAATSPATGAAQIDPETAAWNEAQSLGTAQAYERYLEAYPTGRFADEAFEALVELSLEASQGPATRGFSVDMY